MYIVSVSIHVKQEWLAAFITATLENAHSTRQEPGNLRFDFAQQEQHATRFMLYEVYRAPEDFAAHQQTPHYLLWKAKVADWMAEPRVGLRYGNLFPADSDW